MTPLETATVRLKGSPERTLTVDADHAPLASREPVSRHRTAATGIRQPAGRTHPEMYFEAAVGDDDGPEDHLSRSAGPRPFPLESTLIHVPNDVLTDLRQRLELTRSTRATRTGTTASAEAIRKTRRLLAYRLRLAQGRRRDQRLRALPRSKSRACRCTSYAGPSPDTIDFHVRPAVDVLALVEGHRPAGRSGRVRRRSPPRHWTDSFRPFPASGSRRRCRTTRT